MIAIDRYFGDQIPCVASDNYAGGALAARKLAENGCRKLAFLRIGSNLTSEPNKRKYGFISACEDMQIPYVMKIAEDGTPLSDFEAFLRAHFQDGKLDFDGIFCVTDVLAHQIIGILRHMGLSVPEDVQVIGYDGIRHFGDLDYVCSTIVQPVEEMAEVCVSMVLDRDGERNKPSLVCLPVRYAWGGTTRN